MSDIAKIVVKNIRARLDKAKNQEWLGKESRLGSGAISAILSGKTSNPGIESISKIACALECTVADLTTDQVGAKIDSRDELLKKIGEQALLIDDLTARLAAAEKELAAPVGKDLQAKGAQVAAGLQKTARQARESLEKESEPKPKAHPPKSKA